MEEPNCPFCNSKQKKPLKNWKYGHPRVIDVYRYKCQCGQTFNYYKNQNKTWTVPKRKINYKFIKHVPNKLLKSGIGDKKRLSKIKQKLEKLNLKNLDELRLLQDDIVYMDDLILIHNLIIKKSNKINSNYTQIHKFKKVKKSTNMKEFILR